MFCNSWNVYGRENRLKVARDEAKHAEEQREKLEKQRLVSFVSRFTPDSSHLSY